MAAYQHSPQSKGFKSKQWLAGAVLPFFMILVWWAGAHSTRDAPNWSLILPLAFVSPAFMFLFFRNLRTHAAKNMLAELGWKEGLEFRLDPQRFSFCASGREVNVEWQALTRSLEIPNAYLIYTTPRLAVIMPKRAFAPEELPRVHELLQRRVPQKELRSVARPRRLVITWLVLMVLFLAIWQFVEMKR